MFLLFLSLLLFFIFILFVYFLPFFVLSFFLIISIYLSLLEKPKKADEEGSTESLHTTSISTSISPLSGLFATNNNELEHENGRRNEHGNEYGNERENGSNRYEYGDMGESDIDREVVCAGAISSTLLNTTAAIAARSDSNCRSDCNNNSSSSSSSSYRSSSSHGTDTDTAGGMGMGIGIGVSTGDDKYGADNNNNNSSSSNNNNNSNNNNSSSSSSSSDSDRSALQPLGDIELSDMPAIRPNRGPAISLRLKIPPPPSPGVIHNDSITKNQYNIQTPQKEISDVGMDRSIDDLNTEKEDNYGGKNSSEKVISDKNNNRYSDKDDDFKLRKLKIKI